MALPQPTPLHVSATPVPAPRVLPLLSLQAPVSASPLVVACPLVLVVPLLVWVAPLLQVASEASLLVDSLVLPLLGSLVVEDPLVVDLVSYALYSANMRAC